MGVRLGPRGQKTHGLTRRRKWMVVHFELKFSLNFDPSRYVTDAHGVLP